MSKLYIMKKGVSTLSDLADGVSAGNLLKQGGGAVYYLDPTDGLDTNNGLTPQAAFKTLPVAYAALADGENDILYYIAGTSSISLSAEFEWAKSYTHFIGVCAPVHAAERARIFLAAGDLDASPLFLVSGSGCVLANLYIFSGVDDAQALIDVEITGDRNYFENVHFAGAGHASNAIDGACSVKMNGAAENLFVHCTFGVDTVDAAAGVTALLFAGAASTRNVFEDCNFTLHAGAAGISFIEMVGQNMIDRYTIFKNCLFINLSTTAMTVAMIIEGGNNGDNKRFLMKDCALVGATDWSSIAAMVYLNTGVITGGTNAGLFVVNS
ncbi:MAG: hypothetical protein C0391_03890 [Anaerolinea sp.]|nr:hypothetical protein [Anaerolinea sp.]